MCEKLPWLLIIQKNEGRHTRRVGEGGGGGWGGLSPDSGLHVVRGRGEAGVGAGGFAVPAAVPPKCQLRGPGLCPERGHSWPAAAGCHRER